MQQCNKEEQVFERTLRDVNYNVAFFMAAAAAAAARGDVCCKEKYYVLGEGGGENNRDKGCTDWSAPLIAAG